MSKEKRFIDWVPVMIKHRPYSTMVFETGPRRCDRCGGLRLAGQLTQYPHISDRAVREVCDSCLDEDKKSGLFDAIMEIWNNYEEFLGIGARRRWRKNE